MKIVTWNCNGLLSTKYPKIEKLNADIYIIQECENPKKSNNSDYKSFASNHIWIGDNNKGLGVFAKDNIKLELISHSNQYKYFIPCKVNNTFNLLAVWNDYKNIMPVYNFYITNKKLFNNKMVICGDFNNNAIFDNNKGVKNHSQLVHIFKDYALKSAYHFFNKEKHGSEKQATSYRLRHLNRPYHTDFVFLSPMILKDFKIYDYYNWINSSSHLPILFEIDENKFKIVEKVVSIDYTESNFDKRITSGEVRDKLNELSHEDINKIAKFHMISVYGNKYTRIDKLMARLPLRTLLQNITAIKYGLELEKYVPKDVKIEIPVYPKRKFRESDEDYRFRINRDNK